jgi:hypothetical protein
MPCQYTGLQLGELQHHLFCYVQEVDIAAVKRLLPSICKSGQRRNEFTRHLFILRITLMDSKSKVVIFC